MAHAEAGVPLHAPSRDRERHAGIGEPGEGGLTWKVNPTDSQRVMWTATALALPECCDICNGTVSGKRLRACGSRKMEEFEKVGSASQVTKPTDAGLKGP